MNRGEADAMTAPTADARWSTRRLLALGALLALVAVAVALAIREAEEGPEPLARAASRYAGSLQHGETVGRLTFPKFHKTVTVRAGFEQADIDRGPSWYPGGLLPGAGGTIYVAGHRRTHGGPFREIGGLRRGDEVVFTTPYAIATYSVTHRALIPERRNSVLVSGRGEQLRLQASTIPAGHRRLVVFARLEATERR
jgi:LPXTG-site transpeptidase (sortase) family protein